MKSIAKKAGEDSDRFELLLEVDGESDQGTRSTGRGRLSQVSSGSRAALKENPEDINARAAELMASDMRIDGFNDRPANIDAKTVDQIETAFDEAAKKKGIESRLIVGHGDERILDIANTLKESGIDLDDVKVVGPSGTPDRIIVLMPQMHPQEGLGEENMKQSSLNMDELSRLSTDLGRSNGIDLVLAEAVEEGETDTSDISDWAAGKIARKGKQKVVGIESLASVNSAILPQARGSVLEASTGLDQRMGLHNVVLGANVHEQMVKQGKDMAILHIGAAHELLVEKKNDSAQVTNKSSRLSLSKIIATQAPDNTAVVVVNTLKNQKIDLGKAEVDSADIVFKNAAEALREGLVDDGFVVDRK